MLVNDAFGRKVSLLNDSGGVGGPLPKTSPSHPSSPRSSCLSRGNSYAYSRKSSYCSESSSHASEKSNYDSPVYSPGLRPTPQLLRLDSSSSQQSLQTPSPMTPTYQFDPLDQNKSMSANSNEPYFRQNGQYFPPQQPLPVVSPAQGFFPMTSPGPMLLDASFPMQPELQAAPPQYQYPTDLMQQTQLSLVSPVQPSVLPTPSNAAPANNSNSKGAKKKYPCPHATRYGCSDTFTTSGHAARHGKKHTGEKNILCPTCKKAFTRKDNMKQHERTHRQTRDSAPAASADTTKRPKNITVGAPSESTEPSTKMDMDDADADPQATIRPTRPTMKRSPLQLSDTHPMSFEPADRAFNLLDVDYTEGDGAAACIQDHEPDYRRKFAATQPPQLHLDTLDKPFSSSNEPFPRKRNIDGEAMNSYNSFKPSLDRTTSTGSGLGSQDGEGESPGLDALANLASKFR